MIRAPRSFRMVAVGVTLVALQIGLGAQPASAADSIVVTATTLSPTEFATFNGQVATFTSTDGAATTSSFTASINWGDGTTTTPVSITGAAGSFAVNGTHTYADEGSFTISVTVTNTSAGGSGTGTATATVAEADSLVVTAIAPSPTQGVPLTNVVVASVSDTAAGNVATDFTATIDWGDGTSTAGTITGGGGTFGVTGSHTYVTSGTKTMTVTMREDAPGTTGASGTANVSVAAATDTDLALTGVPANITVFSLTPVVVTYTPPTVVDEDIPKPTVGCSPASGSVFPVGTTTVTCTVTDADDFPSTVTATFTVTVGLGLPGGGGGGGGGGTGTPPTGALALSAQPGGGPAGTKVHVSSVSPCAPGSTGVVISLLDAQGHTLASGQASTFNANTWAGTVTVPHGAAPGVASISATCLSGATPVASYGAAPFTITGGGHHHNRHHHHHH